MSNIISKTTRTINNWWLFTIMGSLLIAGGIYIFQTPQESYKALSLLISILILTNGIFDIIFSIRNRKFSRNWGWYLAEGIFKSIIGSILIANPEITMNILPYVIGFYILTNGGSLISTSLDLKTFYIKGWRYILALGILSIILSVIILMKPEIGAATMVAITGLSFVIVGISHIALSLKLRKVRVYISKNIKSFKSIIRNDFNQYQEQLLKAK